MPWHEITQSDGFLWDFDGTFMDTETHHFRSYLEVFGTWGHTMEKAYYFQSFTQEGEGAAREIAKAGLPTTSAEIASLKDRAYLRIIQQTPPLPFAHTQALTAAMVALGKRVAIASNSSEGVIREILGPHPGLLGVLSLIQGKEPRLQKKPAPDLFLAAAAHLGLKRPIVLEDSSRGLLAAAAAGFPAFFLRTPDNEGLHTPGPRLASVTHGELLEMLGRVD